MASISNSARRASKMPQLDNDDQYLPSDAVLMERIRPNHKSHSDFSQIFGSGLKLNEATAASSKSNITPASAANTSTSTAPRVGSLPRLNIINSNSFSDPVAPPRIRHSVTTMESSSPIRRQQLTQQQDVPSVSRKLSHHSALSSSRPSDAIGTFKLEPFSLEQEAATANRSPPVTTSSPLRKPSIRSSPSSASSPLRNELKKAYTSSPIREVQFEEEGEELYEDTVAADATLTQLPQLDSFNHITETQKLLLDCSVFSTSVEKKFKEGVKFAGIVHDVKVIIYKVRKRRGTEN